MNPLAPIVRLLDDPTVIVAVQQFFGPAWLGFFLVVTQLGDVGGLLVVVALVRWLRGRSFTFPLLGAILVGALLSAVFGCQEARQRGKLQIARDPEEHEELPGITLQRLRQLRRVPQRRGKRDDQQTVGGPRRVAREAEASRTEQEPDQRGVLRYQRREGAPPGDDRRVAFEPQHASG